MHVKAIIKGQKIAPARVERSRELRREMTPAETALWHALRGDKQDSRHFRRQQIIGDYIVDFYCHQAGLVVEVDGPIHLQQKEYDADRDRILETMGLRIIHVTNDQVLEDLPSVLQKIHSAINENA
jgi:very-short-patch-repair endonuclease